MSGPPRSGGEPRRDARAEDPVRRGEADARRAEREPAALAGELASFGATTPREIVLRRGLLALRAPAGPLAALGVVIPGRARRQLWSEFASRYAYWLGVRRAVDRRRWVQLTHGVPVLMYHAFGPEPEHARYIVSPRRLGRQLRILRLLGYRIVPLERIATGLRDHDLPPPRALALTFDDGYRDNLPVARMLAAQRTPTPATLYVVSRRIGASNDWDDGGELAGRPTLTREELAEASACGVAIGAHTRRHVSLPDVPAELLDAEIAGSREDLEQALGIAVTTFSYPRGRHDRPAVEAARRAGFAGAVTTEPHLVWPGDDPLRIPRIEIFGTDSVRAFVRKVLFGGA